MTDDGSDYSVWLTLEPGTPPYQQYREAISELAATHKDAPVFEPHITVVGGSAGTAAELTATVRSLAGDRELIDVTFGPIRCSTTRHQCVFRLIDPSVELFRLRQAAVEGLDLAPTAYKNQGEYPRL